MKINEGRKERIPALSAPKEQLKVFPKYKNMLASGVMSGLKEQVLALPEEEKREIFRALQSELANEPIPEPLSQVLEERRAAYRAGQASASDADAAFDRLLEKYPGETDDR